MHELTPKRSLSLDERPARLVLAVTSHALLRIASSAGGTLIGIWLAVLSRQVSGIDARLVGALAASSFGAELVGSVPLGTAADAVSMRTLMSLGALLGAAATLLFALQVSVPLFFASRVLEGLAVAAVTPALLRLLATDTAHDPGWRAKMMSGFELSLLAGLALGALVGSQLWIALARRAFATLAVLYGACAMLLWWSVPTRPGAGREAALRGLRRALADAHVRRLAPVWLCVNAVIGLWLGPTLSFVLSEPRSGQQYLDGIFAAHPGDIGWLLLLYAIVFAGGLTLWATRLPRVGARATMRVSLWAMLAVCTALGLLNHSAGWPVWGRAMLGLAVVLLVMLESGFGPAALSWLAESLGVETGAGATMGIYSVLLSLGALAGSLVGGWAAARWHMDGLLMATALLAACALLLLSRMPAAATSPGTGPPKKELQMPIIECDLVIIGAGAAGLIAADFAHQLGAKVALIEKDRIGGDCTWTGCVPSKSLVKVAGVAHLVRTAARYGLTTAAPAVDMAAVRAYLRNTIEHIYAPTAPEALRAKGLAVYLGSARFIDPHTVEAGETRLRARRVLICTGAAPRRPDLPGLGQIPYHTYQDIFDNTELPETLLVIGGGPVGCEIAQCYRRLGAQVVIIAKRLLPRVEPVAAQRLAQVFANEGIVHCAARAEAVSRDGGHIRVRTTSGEVTGDRLLLAVGRAPRTEGLNLEAAGVRYGPTGIEVDPYLQSSARHIYAAGDVLGGGQFSHLAGWQGFQAVRNALLPGRTRGLPEAVPEITFTVPEVAHVGLTEEAARARFGTQVHASSLELARVDRAVSEDDTIGLVKLVTHRNGRILGASIVGERAGEALAEVSLALSRQVKVRALAASIHPYPTYNSAIQLLATQIAIEQRLAGLGGRVLRRLSRMTLNQRAR